MLDEIILMKSYAVNMMFKEAVILQNEPLSFNTVKVGMRYLKTLIEKTMENVN